MFRIISIACLILLAITLIGCGFTGKSLVAKQTWSDNYAKGKGVEATSPLMVDGDAKTMAESQLPTDVSAGATRYTEAVVKLPEIKKIRKIVVQSSNLRSFNVYAGGRGPDDWISLKEFKNIEESKVSMNVSVNTDRIKIRVTRTTDDTTQPGGRGGQATLKHAPAKIGEIELYGFAEEVETQPVATSPVAAGSTSVVTGSTITTTTTTTTTTSGSTETTRSSAVEVPKGPPVAATLETEQKTYPLAGPIPLKINIKAGADEVVVLEDVVSDGMVSTKLVIKSSTGDAISCSKPTPPLSSPRPYRAEDRPLDVRNAKTIAPDTVVSINIPNILDYYPIKTPGTYKIQLSMFLDLHNKFVGREATAMADLEKQIRDINSKSNYTPQEKAAYVQSLKEEMQQTASRKSKRYIEASGKGIPFKLESDTIEITIQ